MENTMRWRVKSKGRIERIIIFYSGLTLMALGGLASFGIYPWEKDFSWNIDFVDISFFFVIFLLPVLHTTFVRLLSKRIPKEIELDSINQVCRIIYSSTNKKEIQFENLAYSKNNFSLSLFATFIGTRGQRVFTKLTEIIAFDITFSWRKRDLNGIVNELIKLGIPKTKSDNSGLTLLERLISN